MSETKRPVTVSEVPLASVLIAFADVSAAERRMTDVFVLPTSRPVAVFVAIALAALNGENPEQETLLTPQLFQTGDAELTEIYAPDQQPGWSTYVDIEPYTTYAGSADVAACLGPGE